jgi:hypothetical protein
LLFTDERGNLSQSQVVFVMPKAVVRNCVVERHEKLIKKSVNAIITPTLIKYKVDYLFVDVPNLSIAYPFDDHVSYRNHTLSNGLNILTFE